MRTQGRLTDKEMVDIVDAYINRLVPMITLAKQYAITRQSVYKVLQKAGIDTGKAATILSVSCTCCGKVFPKRRCQVRRSKHVFCCNECYYAWLQHGNGNPLIMHRDAQRTARKVVAFYHTLLPGEITHHEDRNQFNNDPFNLKVFASQGDHVRYHRGFVVPIIWEGSVLSQQRL